MATSSAAPTEAGLRQALRDEVKKRELRPVSRLVGISPARLKRFIDGARPYGANRRRLERWYVLHGPGRQPGGLTGGSAFTILRVILQDVAPGRHRHTMEQLVKSLGDAYATAHIPEPAWLAEVRARVQRRPVTS